ncbi:MAG: hypothetical protein JSS07_09525, partial [Proteobacteria bacterium]|nr:hypothetical protein [Pseudomonadota bacterium]
MSLSILALSLSVKTALSVPSTGLSRLWVVSAVFVAVYQSVAVLIAFEVPATQLLGLKRSSMEKWLAVSAVLVVSAAATVFSACKDVISGELLS